MEAISQLVSIFLHLDVHLNELANSLGGWLYVVLFLIVFCETGLVVTPILPGDSLLFAAGAIASIEGSRLSLPMLILVLVTAAVLGDAVNYFFGFSIGPKVFTREDSILLNKKHLLRTQMFYERHGGKTIILARFIPIIRTFAPFVAGIGKMQYRRFALFNVVGGASWVLLFLSGGFLLGNVPTLKQNFHYIIVGIVAISCLPIVIEYFLARRRRSMTSSVSSPSAVA